MQLPVMNVWMNKCYSRYQSEAPGFIRPFGDGCKVLTYQRLCYKCLNLVIDLVFRVYTTQRIDGVSKIDEVSKIGEVS